MYRSVFLAFTAIAMAILLFSGCSVNMENNVRIDERNIAEFDSVSVTTSLSDIEFVESDRYGLDLFVPRRFAPDWDVSSGRLTIQEKTTDIIFNLSINSPRYYVKVYYPAGTCFSDISLVTSSGSVRLPQVDVKDLDIRSSSGAINANAEKSDRVAMNTSSGDITYTGSGGFVDLRTSSGAVRSIIEDCDAIHVTTSSGDVNVAGKGDLATNLNVHTQSGKIRVAGATWQDITTVSSSGETAVSGELLGNTSITTSSGSVSISVAGDPSYYGYALRSSSGTILWNGEKMGKPAISSGSFENHIEVSTSSGSIRVDFVYESFTPCLAV